MARKTRYSCDINGEYFATADALRRRCRQLIDRYLYPGCPADIEMADDDASFFVQLVRLRDPHRRPVGFHINRVLRSTRDGQVGRHVKIVWNDGLCDLLGWSKLCGGRPCDATVVANAMRESIRYQMAAAYSSFFGGMQYRTCPKSGLTISLTGEFADDAAEVHHDGMPFAEIRDKWLELLGITLADVPLKDLFDGGGYEVEPGALADSWKAFHAEHARLTVVSRTWHRGRDAHGTKTEQGEAADGRDADTSAAAADSTVDSVGLHGLRRREEAEEGAAAPRPGPRHQLQRPVGLEDV